MSVSRSLEIMKKKIVSLKAKNLEISNNFVLKDQCFHNLKSQLGKIKDYNKKMILMALESWKLIKKC
jgi:hypothetical protein